MGRRRLRVLSSSDEEDDQQHSQQQNQNRSQQPQQVRTREQQVEEEVEIRFEEPLPNIETVALDSSSSGPVQAERVSDDDEEFIDVSDHLTPPSPSPPTAENSATASAIPSSDGASHCPVSGVLRSLGLNLRAEWLDSCIRGLEIAVPRFSGFDSETKAKFCFEQFLCSDMNFSGGGILPPNVDSMHLVELAGPFVLQVDEITNISCSLRQRYQNAPAGSKRCLKLSMTDGVQRVFGMEYRPIKDLEVLAMAGFKVAIKGVAVRRGLLMLVPEVLEVLGGSVQDLEAARQRLVLEINKPPRGKRTRRGVVPSLATRGTLAAWPQNGVNNPLENSTSVQHCDTSTRQDLQGSAPSVGGSDTLQRTEDSVVVPASRNTDELPTYRDATEHPIMRDSIELSTNGMVAEDNSTVVTDVQDVDMADPIEHPFLLRGDKELPFTYLASLSAKWASVKGQVSHVQGKIKCFLTGVKSFHYKQRITFELHVHVDDGSLISEVLVHHDVVQKAIGYSPGEVAAALSSSDAKTVDSMKENLKKFQIFLANFEGTVLVELNEASTLPIAIEMTQGCPASDVWLLLRRCVNSDTGMPENDRLLYLALTRIRSSNTRVGSNENEP